MHSLKNHLLIAMPSLDDPYFKRSVVYICEHDEEGAMGLIINQPISQLSVKQLLAKLKMPDDDSNNLLNKQVFNGGPLNQERGFVLHSPQTSWPSSALLGPEIMLTTSKDILQVLGTAQAPSNYLIALGYAGWGASQLEQELLDNSWLTLEADPDILFNTLVDDRWEQATKQLGFDIWQLTSQTGHS